MVENRVLEGRFPTTNFKIILRCRFALSKRWEVAWEGCRCLLIAEKSPLVVDGSFLSIESQPSHSPYPLNLSSRSKPMRPKASQSDGAGLASGEILGRWRGAGDFRLFPRRFFGYFGQKAEVAPGRVRPFAQLRRWAGGAARRRDWWRMKARREISRGGWGDLMDCGETGRCWEPSVLAVELWILAVI